MLNAIVGYLNKYKTLKQNSWGRSVLREKGYFFEFYGFKRKKLHNFFLKYGIFRLHFVDLTSMIQKI